MKSINQSSSSSPHVFLEQADVIRGDILKKFRSGRTGPDQLWLLQLRA